jgi:hypothetical protein
MSPYKEYYFYHIAYRATCQVPDLYSKIPAQLSVVPYKEGRQSEFHGGMGTRQGVPPSRARSEFESSLACTWTWGQPVRMRSLWWGTAPGTGT